MKPTPEMIEAAIVAHDKAYAEWSTRKKCMEAALTAALALVDTGEPKPVSWRWKEKKSAIWIYDPIGEWLDECRDNPDIDLEPLFASPPSPVVDTGELYGYAFQHEETGLQQIVDIQQVEWGFEKNNPRWQKIGPVYLAPPPPVDADAIIERCAKVADDRSSVFSLKSQDLRNWDGDRRYYSSVSFVVRELAYQIRALKTLSPKQDNGQVIG